MNLSKFWHCTLGMADPINRNLVRTILIAAVIAFLIYAYGIT